MDQIGVEPNHRMRSEERRQTYHRRIGKKRIHITGGEERRHHRMRRERGDTSQDRRGDTSKGESGEKSDITRKKDITE